MPNIKVLDEDLINKIAAGEVVERPASVVKELVENSLDAGATIINIEIKNSGQDLIKVSDNGSGMEEEDARNSILRHATSKISSEEDLFAINTLGFRGEALASIAAVSQLSIITKQAGQIEAFNLAVESGEIISSGILAAETGTTIEVRNLFFNTPARKKFLKTDAVELGHIIDVVLRYALINPEVAFNLTHDGHPLLNSPSVDNLQNNIASVYGIKLAKELLEVNHEQEGISIYGYVVKPHLARNDKTQQMIYVNGRWVRNEEVSKAVYEAYHSLLFVGKHPVFILNLKVDPQKIDVNIHPQKTEIKFEEKNKIFKAVFTAVKNSLQNHNLIPVMDLEAEQQLIFGTSVSGSFSGQDEKEINGEIGRKGEIGRRRDIEKRGDVEKRESGERSRDRSGERKHYYPLERSEQTFLGKILGEKENEEYATPEEEIIIPEQWKEQLTIEKIPPLRVLGQINRTFFVAETADGVMFIDQHVVQERILYEKFMGQLMNKNVATQSLLRGEMLEFNVLENLLVNQKLAELQRLGFQLESFGENTYLLKTIPSVFGRMQPKELLFEVLENLKQNKNKLETVQEEIITRMACRASIKAGDIVTISEIQQLLDELANCNLPYTCPHGRSIMIKVTVEELEKKFRRK